MSEENIPENSSIFNTFIYKIANLFVNIYLVGITPNMVTTLTLILRGIIIYSIYRKKLSMIAILIYFITWITDALDGQIARTHNAGSTFGGIYDPVVDVVTTVGLYLILYFKYYTNKKILFLFYAFLILGVECLLFIKNKCRKKTNNKMKGYEKAFQNVDELLQSIDLTADIYNNDTLCRNSHILKYFDEGYAYLVIFTILIHTIISNHKSSDM